MLYPIPCPLTTWVESSLTSDPEYDGLGTENKWSIYQSMIKALGWKVKTVNPKNTQPILEIS